MRRMLPTCLAAKRRTGTLKLQVRSDRTLGEIWLTIEDQPSYQDSDGGGFECLFGDGTGRDTANPLRDDGSISAQSPADLLLPSPQVFKRDGQGPPLATSKLVPFGPNKAAERGGESPPDEQSGSRQIQDGQPAGEHDRDPEVRGPMAEQEEGLYVGIDADGKNRHAGSPLSTADRVESFGNVDTEQDDSDVPMLARRRRRRRRRSSARSPDLRAQILTPSTKRSRLHSVEVESGGEAHSPRRLGRGRKMPRDSISPGSDVSCATDTLSTSVAGITERWPLRCFLQRKIIGSQETITIELPAFDLRDPSKQGALRACPDTAVGTIPLLATARGNRRRARFSQAEEDLLVQLKERRDRKFSWKEIQRHFPDRMVGSLQVHYSTYLKGRRLSKRRTLRG